ncbi:spore germination protein [Desulfotomaculum sp. 1211_IL3151]
MVSTKGWEKRAGPAPQSETVVRGQREGFTENLRTNTSPIRRKIRSEQLRVDHMTVDRKTQIDVCLMYLSGVTDLKVIKTVKDRVSQLDVDSILESGYIEEYIEDAPFSPFATVGYSEKPDVVADRHRGRWDPLCAKCADAVYRKLPDCRRLLCPPTVRQRDMDIAFHCIFYNGVRSIHIYFVDRIPLRTDPYYATVYDCKRAQGNAISGFNRGTDHGICI